MSNLKARLARLKQANRAGAPLSFASNAAKPTRRPLSGLGLTPPSCLQINWSLSSTDSMADERRPHEAQRSSIAERQYAMTCQEVADALGISAQRVSQVQARALKKLRKGLLARGYGPAEIDNLPSWLIVYWLELL